VLNPVHLQTFVEVMRTGSFALAARRLGYTPSAVSQQVSALERATRVRLFHREASAVSPTAAAQELLQRTQLALGSLRSVEAMFEAYAAGQAGPVRLGSFPTASQRLVPAALARLRNTHPQLTVHLDEAEPDTLASMIRTQEIDLALVYTYDAVPETRRHLIVSEVLLTEQILLVVPATHRLAGRERVGFADLADEQWIGTRRGTAAGVLLNRLAAEAGYTPQIAHQSNDYAVIQELVGAGLGIALVPALGYVSDPRRRSLTLDAEGAVRRVATMVNDADGPVEAVAHLCTQLRRAARTVAQNDHLLDATTAE